MPKDCNDTALTDASLHEQNLDLRGCPPPTICAWIDRPVNALQVTTLLLTVFAQSNFVADFLRDTEQKVAKNGHFAFFRPRLGASEAGYDVHLRFIGKRVVDFLLVITELFLNCYACGATSEYRLGSAVLEGVGSLCSKISDRRGHPPPTICARTDRPMNALQLCRWKFSHKETL